KFCGRLSKLILNSRSERNNMSIAELIKNTLKEAQELMTSKTVVGEPIKTDTHTVIPVSKVMFGFAGGGGEGDEKGKKGNGQGVGGGWSIEPVAFVVVGEDGAKLMTIGDKESLTGKLMDLAPSVIDSVKEFVSKNDSSEEEAE
ncbi:MAG: spore germination protein GerW family protein, partial [Candidatus Marinimicrobia bacterium]|nr:spore germination protein GerW family protein [Candidatus Neomarinimicrobiota bacterium]MDP7330364.1 spore germination protein GerW family protein [Candidatus Neomarinimicrobiota bacterium]